uniref:Uncharacterized protein n=1 Tax=Opuntia streptacantha TaxID=393608 RepID=A0A7C9EDM9_OPUST
MVYMFGRQLLKYIFIKRPKKITPPPRCHPQPQNKGVPIHITLSVHIQKPITIVTLTWTTNITNISTNKAIQTSSPRVASSTWVFNDNSLSLHFLNIKVLVRSVAHSCRI